MSTSQSTSGSKPLDIVEFCLAVLYGRRCIYENGDVVWFNGRGEGLSFAEYSRRIASGAREVSL